MVRVLISMRAAALRNVRHSTFGTVSLIGTAVFGLVVALSTVLLGITATGSALHGTDQLALVILTWMAGRVGFAAFAGSDPAVPLDLFRIVPADRRKLARSLLLLGLAEPSVPFLGLAFASVVVYGFRIGVVAGLAGIVGMAGTLVLASFLSTIVAALVPAGSRRRQDLGTLLAACLISAVVVLGTLVQSLLALLSSGQAPALAVLLRVLPSGWAGDAVSAAASGDVLGTLLPLAVIAAACVGLFACWPRVLTGRLLTQATSASHGRTRVRRRLLPATATGAVVSRELRLWIRDPNRAGFLLIAFIVGLGICIVPLISQSTALLLPFAGAGTAIIAGAIAGNSYGFDGGSLALILDAGAGRSDVRGRQLAWLLLVGPYSVLLSAAGVLVAGQAWATPWVSGLLPAVLGGAVGIIPLVSLLAPQPLDDNGSPGPAWVVKTYATMALIAISAVPPLVFLIAGATTGSVVLSWLGLPAGMISGMVCAVVLGRLASSRLIRRGPEIFLALAHGGARG